MRCCWPRRVDSVAGTCARVNSGLRAPPTMFEAVQGLVVVAHRSVMKKPPRAAAITVWVSGVFGSEVNLGSRKVKFFRPLTMDTSAREAMKDAAKCDNHCELQNSANQLKSERTMLQGGLPLWQVLFSVSFPPTQWSLELRF